jgi:hypothetical protein
VAVVALLSAGGLAVAAEPVPFAVVIGSNHGSSASVEDLRFGDDDAIMNARMFEMLGARTILLVAPDAETRELFGILPPHAEATQAALRAAFARTAAAVAVARADHQKTRLYFVFAGHGDVIDGRPFLQLDDGRLWREDLAEMLRGAGADENHVVVDACHSASFVGDRGSGGERAPAPVGFSRGERHLWPPRTGFLTAQSWGGQAHEWAEFQAGIFSHEVRSALAGAADVNLDGRVSYREMAAFIRRANESIPNRRYRPQVATVSPNDDLDASLATLPAGPMLLELDLLPAGRTFVETESGVRLVDLHAADGVPIYLRLPIDLGSLFIEQVATRRELRLEPRAGRVRASSLTANAPVVRARGAAHEAFLLLFARPFDPAAVATFQLETPPGVESEKPAFYTRRRWPAWLLTGTGAAALAAAAVTAYSAHALAADGASADGASRPALNDQIDRRNDVAWITAGAGLALTAAGLVWWSGSQGRK